MAELPALPRILRLGSVGRDVRALQRALKDAGVRTGPPAANPTTFDDDTDDQVRTFQKYVASEDSGLPAYSTLVDCDEWVLPVSQRSPTFVSSVSRRADTRI